MTHPDLSLIFPCYKEEGHLIPNLERVIRQLELFRFSAEIILVDDKSPDNTALEIREFLKRSPPVPVTALFHVENQGRGAAFLTGARNARGRVVGFLDIDLEVSPTYLSECLPPLFENKADMALPRRTFKVTPSNLYRHLLSRGYAWLAQHALGIPKELDTEAGFKFFRRQALEPYLDRFENFGWFWDTEVVCRFLEDHLRIHSFPCLFVRDPRKKSTVRPLRDSLEYAQRLWSYRRQRILFSRALLATIIPAT